MAWIVHQDDSFTFYISFLPGKTLIGVSQSCCSKFHHFLCRQKHRTFVDSTAALADLHDCEQFLKSSFCNQPVRFFSPQADGQVLNRIRSFPIQYLNNQCSTRFMLPPEQHSSISVYRNSSVDVWNNLATTFAVSWVEWVEWVEWLWRLGERSNITNWKTQVWNFGTLVWWECTLQWNVLNVPEIWIPGAFKTLRLRSNILFLLRC